VEDGNVCCAVILHAPEMVWIVILCRNFLVCLKNN